MTPFTVSFPVSSTAPTAFSPSFAESSTAPTAATSERSVLADIAALKAIATPALPLGTVRNVEATGPGQQEAWTLGEGTTADNPSGGIARPTDYASETNERIWTRTV